MRPAYNPLMPPGHVWRQAHQASVRAILGKKSPPVHSQGTQFYNVDRWTARFMVHQMCQWASKHPGQRPTRAHVKLWVDWANKQLVPASKRAIYIAATPDKLNWTIARALSGGSYHEAFHTKYTRRKDLTVEEVWKIVDPRWDLVPNWGPYMALLLEWYNLIEDIRIERCGGREYDGIHQSMCDLQDFILDMEKDSTSGGRAHSEEDPTTTETEWSELQVVGATFRDIGLGYSTPKQKKALTRYQAMQPGAYKMVSEGSLRPLLDEAISLSDTDDLGCLRLALDIISVLHKVSKQSPPQPQQGAEDPQNAEPGEDSGGDGKGESDGDEKGESDGDEKGEGSGEDESNGDGTEGEGSEASGEEKSEDADGRNSQGKGSGPGEGEPEGQPVSDRGGTPTSQDEPTGEPAVAQSVLSQAGAGTSMSLLDLSQALQEAIEGLLREEDYQLEPGEMPWRPWDQTIDTTSFINDNIPTSGKRADRLFDEVMKEIMFLRARLHMIIKSVQDNAVYHGIPHGQDLSEPFLVDTMIDLLSGEKPQRAFYEVDEEPEMSLAAVVVIDQSGSMGSIRSLAAKILMTIVEPLDFLRYPVMALGFRVNGNRSSVSRVPPRYHRANGIHFDLFKTFDERFNRVKWRFGETIASGGTPMSDGVQFGLSALEERPEFHRILFVVTDGCPTNNHTRVIRWQLRRAREMGVYVIGVGIGKSSVNVQYLFEDHVWAENMHQLPLKLLDKLNTILDFRRNRVGKAMDRANKPKVRR